MNHSQKLVLVAALFVTGGATLALVLQRDPAQEDLPSPAKKKSQLVHQLMNLDPAPEDMPDDAKQVQTYLDGRWGDRFDDEGIVAAGVDPSGEKFYVAKRAIVGRTGSGKTIYAQSIMRAHKFEGQVFKYKDSPLRSNASVKFDKKEDGGVFQRLPKGKAGKIPLDQIPGGGWGDLGKIEDTSKGPK